MTSIVYYEIVRGGEVDRKIWIHGRQTQDWNIFKLSVSKMNFWRVISWSKNDAREFEAKFQNQIEVQISLNRSFKFFEKIWHAISFFVERTEWLQKQEMNIIISELCEKLKKNSTLKMQNQFIPIIT